MFKLITEEEESKLMREYSARRTVVILLVLSAVLTVGFVGLLPSYLLSQARKSETLERHRVSSILGGTEGKDSKAWLARTNEKIANLTPEPDTETPSYFMGALIRAKASAISINTLSWNSKSRKLSVSGIAVDRRALIQFEEALNALGLFSSVLLPVSNLAKESDINFSIELTAI